MHFPWPCAGARRSLGAEIRLPVYRLISPGCPADALRPVRLPSNLADQRPAAHQPEASRSPACRTTLATSSLASISVVSARSSGCPGAERIAHVLRRRWRPARSPAATRWRWRPAPWHEPGRPSRAASSGRCRSAGMKRVGEAIAGWSRSSQAGGAASRPGSLIPCRRARSADSIRPSVYRTINPVLRNRRVHDLKRGISDAPRRVAMPFSEGHPAVRADDGRRRVPGPRDGAGRGRGVVNRVQAGGERIVTEAVDQVVEAAADLVGQQLEVGPGSPPRCNASP